MIDIKKMTKDELMDLDEKIRYFERIGNDAADKALQNGNIAELDRLEDLLRKLNDFGAVVYSKIQNYKYHSVNV